MSACPLQAILALITGSKLVHDIPSGCCFVVLGIPFDNPRPWGSREVGGAKCNYNKQQLIADSRVRQHRSSGRRAPAYRATGLSLRRLTAFVYLAVYLVCIWTRGRYTPQIRTDTYLDTYRTCRVVSHPSIKGGCWQLRGGTSAVEMNVQYVYCT